MRTRTVLAHVVFFVLYALFSAVAGGFILDGHDPIWFWWIVFVWYLAQAITRWVYIVDPDFRRHVEERKKQRG